MLIVLKMNRKLCFFPSPFFSCESFFTWKCTFFSIAKVFVAKFAEKSVIRESLCPQFRDFFFSRNFLPARVSAPKVDGFMLNPCWARFYCRIQGTRRHWSSFSPLYAGFHSVEFYGRTGSLFLWEKMLRCVWIEFYWWQTFHCAMRQYIENKRAPLRFVPFVS